MWPARSVRVGSLGLGLGRPPVLAARRAQLLLSVPVCSSWDTAAGGYCYVPSSGILHRTADEWPKQTGGQRSFSIIYCM
jgi:hypothetical protein